MEFFLTLDEVDHEGFHIHHYSWDGALYSSCTTLACKYHTVVLRKLMDKLPAHIGRMKLLKSWLLTSGCGLHSIHNSFTWGISEILQGNDSMLDDLFIVLSSLRNGYKHLQTHLSSFLVDHVEFSDIGVGRDDLYSFWSCLDLPPELGSLLADSGVFWRDDRFYVDPAYKDDQDILTWLYDAVMTAFRFKKYSTSRWLTVGSSCRTLLASLALGLDRLHEVCILDPKVSNYYLNGFSKLSTDMRRFIVVAALSSRPAEALGISVLEDDRAVRQIVTYENILAEEMNWLKGGPEPVWQLLSLASISGSPCSAIRNDCLDCA